VRGVRDVHDRHAKVLKAGNEIRRVPLGVVSALVGDGETEAGALTRCLPLEFEIAIERSPRASSGS
jgi:hypothetical protein